ncbi:hypothetical protein K491DRAFT_686052 [Lophiostoma macrostomum CBS 122681]|uniref:Uncharacterized protein n=1 Tax=Lophiostoma macrostomum CBS 122681 TaxID=1314788 RepID=A0A6A6TS62_9PLEO|nr:hypothetical protein K491DRAFT_686052 [Lophiostoma macrostomum CBS 122681]
MPNQATNLCTTPRASRVSAAEHGISASETHAATSLKRSTAAGSAMLRGTGITSEYRITECKDTGCRMRKK